VNIQSFSIQIEDDVLSDLRARIRRTRWPVQAEGTAWEQGTDLDYLRAMLEYWADGFDWAAQEHELNMFRHFRADLDGIQIHFVHERARRGRGIPLVLTPGWPSASITFSGRRCQAAGTSPLPRSQSAWRATSQPSSLPFESMSACPPA